MTDPYETSMMDNLYWWGIPTLFRCPNERAEGQDIALVGVPHSTGNGIDLVGIEFVEETVDPMQAHGIRDLKDDSKVRPYDGRR